MLKKQLLNFIEDNNAKDRRKKIIDTNYDKIIANIMIQKHYLKK